jgi:Tfp pilus assembly protein PilO
MNGGRTFSEMLAEIEALRTENEKLKKTLKARDAKIVRLRDELRLYEQDG